MNILNWVFNRLRTVRSRFAYMANRAFGMMYYGTIVHMTYLNYKHDPTPMIFVMYSGLKYTHGLNIHYMSDADKEWLGRMMYMIKKGQQTIDGRTLYQLIKTQRPSIVKTCYRVYFTHMIRNSKTVSAGFTALQKIEFPSEDPYIKSLNAYLNPANQPAYGVQVSYYPDELRDRIIMAQNSIPLNSATTKIGSATKPIQKGTV